MKNEATILARLCHPFLPHLFGVCLGHNPMKIVIQFHGISDKTITLGKQITSQPLRIMEGAEWLILTTQLLEALECLHDHAHTLHNDIKHDNILITEDGNGDLLTYHIVLIDFGKATALQSGCHYTLSEREKSNTLLNIPTSLRKWSMVNTSKVYIIAIYIRLELSSENFLITIVSHHCHHKRHMILKK